MVNQHNQYPKLSIYLHWLMLILITIAFASMEFRGIFPKGTDERLWMKFAHYSVGLTILLLVIVRLGIRLQYKMAAIMPLPPTIMTLAAKAVHVFLYVFMFVMPILGWVIVSAEGKEIFFYGLSLPALVATDSHLAHSVEDIHVQFANIAYFVIGLHALAALFHHYIKRDNTLTRMLP